MRYNGSRYCEFKGVLNVENFSFDEFIDSINKVIVPKMAMGRMFTKEFTAVADHIVELLKKNLAVKKAVAEKYDVFYVSKGEIYCTLIDYIGTMLHHKEENQEIYKKITKPFMAELSLCEQKWSEKITFITDYALVNADMLAKTIKDIYHHSVEAFMENTRKTEEWYASSLIDANFSGKEKQLALQRFHKQRELSNEYLHAEGPCFSPLTAEDIAELETLLEKVQKEAKKRCQYLLDLNSEDWAEIVSTLESVECHSLNLPTLLAIYRSNLQ